MVYLSLISIHLNFWPCPDNTGTRSESSAGMCAGNMGGGGGGKIWDMQVRWTKDKR